MIPCRCSDDLECLHDCIELDAILLSRRIVASGIQNDGYKPVGLNLSQMRWLNSSDQIRNGLLVLAVRLGSVIGGNRLYDAVQRLSLCWVCVPSGETEVQSKPSQSNRTCFVNGLCSLSQELVVSGPRESAVGFEHQPF